MNEETRPGSPSLQQVGAALARLRLRLGLSQTAFGRPAKIKHQQVSRYEKGLERPRLETVVRLLAGHGLTLRDLQDQVDAGNGIDGSSKLEQRLAKIQITLNGLALDRDEIAGEIAERVFERIAEALIGRVVDRRSPPPKPARRRRATPTP